MRRLPLSVRNAEENSNHEMVVQISNELPAVKKLLTAYRMAGRRIRST
ncbi:hypothetical protein D918_10157 [Trichuris suis]|nr:hypothetical protein D918_10157 [Trichuris suis]